MFFFMYLYLCIGRTCSVRNSIVACSLGAQKPGSSAAEVGRSEGSLLLELDWGRQEGGMEPVEDFAVLRELEYPSGEPGGFKLCR